MEGSRTRTEYYSRMYLLLVPAKDFLDLFRHWQTS